MQSRQMLQFFSPVPALHSDGRTLGGSFQGIIVRFLLIKLMVRNTRNEGIIYLYISYTYIVYIMLKYLLSLD